MFYSSILNISRKVNNCIENNDGYDTDEDLC